SVHYHLLSPSCKGLFKRAIAQSGSAYNSWGYARHPRECAYLLGKRLGCNATNDQELLDFLKKASVEDIIDNSERIILDIEEEH
ncbi:carboxylesterase family protein, partial [Klebsiella pneumoniae]|uniref:carboxylesterase family protein n=1 Tax=Klebsiella pneumoniae TaxID=573 RepID=UPI003075BE45